MRSIHGKGGKLYEDQKHPELKTTLKNICIAFIVLVEKGSRKRQKIGENYINISL